MKKLSDLSKKSLSIIMMTWAIIMFLMVGKIQAQSACFNSDFSNGDFTNWTGSYGRNNTGVYVAGSGMVIGATNALPSTAGQQTIINDVTLYDPNTANALRETPPDGSPSCRLGNDLCSSCVGGNPQGAEIQYNYTPNATNCIFTYQYAVVLQDPSSSGHSAAQCPKFFIYVLDSLGQVVDPVCGQYLVTAHSGLPGFNSCMPASTVCTSTVGVVWKDWTSVSIDLSAYINHRITVQFITLDCSLGGHFGYAYISCYCGSMSLTQQCSGSSDIITAPAGFASYAWSPGGGTTQSITIPGAVNGTTYTCQCTSVTGCLITLHIVVDIQPVVFSATSYPTKICPRDSSTITASGSGYSYLWSTGDTTTSIKVSPTSTTTYTVSATASGGCSAFTQAVVIVRPPPRATLTADSVLCNGGSTGSATITPTSGTSPFTYLWNTTPPQTTDTAYNLAVGTYTVLLTDSGGCDTTFSVTVLEPTALAANISASTNVSCNDGSDGTATANPSGGTPSYTYLWNNGESLQTATGLSSGTYTVTVTDSKGCVQTTNVAITQPTPLTASIPTSTNVSCFGGNNGTAHANPSGGTPSYTYVWSTTPVQTNVTATGLTLGTYTVTVTDANSCSQTASITITQPTLVTASITASTDVSCFGGSNGTATANASGGTPGSPPYFYQWNSSPVQITQTATGLPIGTYTVTATDANGCTNTATVSINQPTILAANISPSTNVNCFGGNNGTAQVNPSGGTPSYTYQWTTTPAQTLQTATGLSAGTYTVTVTDANHCIETASVTITQPTALAANISASTDVSCSGGSNGTATVSPSGGTPSYTFIWSNGQSNATTTGLFIGTYTVTVTDSKGCTKTTSVIITQPTPLLANITPSTNVSCFGGSNGTATASPSGGTPSYTYSWNNGQTLQTATGLPIGTYTVTITDANSCSNTATVTITQPTAVVASITASTDVKCYGGYTGSATVSVLGGTPSYTYLWNSSPAQVTSTATGLPAGTYTVTATDANGCTNSTNVTINQPTDILLSIVSFTNVSCFGGNNGSATANATGGVTPYLSFIWDDGETTQTATHLNPGVHTITVTDANGCTKTTTVTITQPAQISMTAVTDSVLCYGQANGSITVNTTGGTPAYSFIWSTGLPGNIASNLHAGTYTCTVTDYNGCIDSIKATVLQPLILHSIVINADTILPCYGLNNGTITIYVVGGTPPWTYHWNTGATGTITLNNLSGGVYTDTITDHNGCKNIHTVVVTQPPALFVQIDSIPESCLNSCDGQLTSAVTGGTPFLGAGGSPYYHYLWNTTPPQTTESITGLCEGIYNLTITDSNGCQRIISNYLGVNDSVVAGFSAAPTSGYIPLTVNFLYTGTSSPANNYTWNFGDGTISSLENPTHIYTTADTFSVWLYITNGVCKDSIHIFVYPEIPSLLIVPNVFTPNGDGYNDEFMVKYQNIKTFSCVIFDRWGKKIYEWDDVTKGWDGKTKGGADCADGTYFYILSAEGWDGIKYTDHGTVTLIRH